MSDKPEETGPSIAQRDLPHWTYSDSIYFVTWRIAKETPDLCPEERSLVSGAISQFHEKRYDLFAWVVMNDHVHALTRLRQGYSLSKVLHTWKSFTANQLQRKFQRRGSVWQDETYDHIIRTEREFYDTVRYILNNAYKRWGVEDYPWVGFNPVED